MATHSSFLVWEILWTEEPGGRTEEPGGRTEEPTVHGIAKSWASLKRLSTQRKAESEASEPQVEGRLDGTSLSRGELGRKLMLGGERMCLRWSC